MFIVGCKPSLWCSFLFYKYLPHRYCLHKNKTNRDAITQMFCVCDSRFLKYTSALLTSVLPLPFMITIFKIRVNWAKCIHVSKFISRVFQDDLPMYLLINFESYLNGINKVIHICISIIFLLIHDKINWLIIAATSERSHGCCGEFKSYVFRICNT